jgi:hypothetical protein
VDTNNNRNKTTNDKSNNNDISRRGFLELGSAAVTGVAGVLAMTGIASAQELVPGVKTGKSTYITDPGPTDKQLDAANPDISVPPPTDAGGLPTFKYPFSFNNRRVYFISPRHSGPSRFAPVTHNRNQPWMIHSAGLAVVGRWLHHTLCGEHGLELHFWPRVIVVLTRNFEHPYIQLVLGGQQHRPRCDLALHRLASIQMRPSTQADSDSSPAKD